MIRSDGTVKIVDFGIARFTDHAVKPVHQGSTGLTRRGMILGTARYMSPEQARGMQLDGRCDIFSMGVVLYEMLTGAAPFIGHTPSDVLAAILTFDPLPLSRNTRGVPASSSASCGVVWQRIPQIDIRTPPRWRRICNVSATPKRTPRRFMPWTMYRHALCWQPWSVRFLLRPSHRQPGPAFRSMSMTPLAIRGDVSDIAISHDGTMVAYVSGEGARQRIHLREISASDDRIVFSTESGNVSGAMFSEDDSYLYYRRSGNDGIGELVRVPVKGGSPEHVADNVSGVATLSPDGKQIAFVRLMPSTWEASLMISNVDGSGEFALQTVRRPRFFDEESVAWSPDGKSIACFAGELTTEWQQVSARRVQSPPPRAADHRLGGMDPTRTGMACARRCPDRHRRLCGRLAPTLDGAPRHGRGCQGDQ